MKPYTGMDGIKRNLVKLWYEAKIVWPAIKQARHSHDPYTNMWVEACEASPYLMGHLGAIVTPILIVLAVWGWAT